MHKIVTSCNFGRDPRATLIFYKAFEQGKVGNVESHSMRKALGLMRSTSREIIYNISANLPPRYRFEQETAKAGGFSYGFLAATR